MANPRNKGIKEATKPNPRKYRKPTKGNVFPDRKRPRNGELIITPGSEGIAYKHYRETPRKHDRKIIVKAEVSHDRKQQIIRDVVGAVDLVD